jgi:hypothetical protein
MFRLAPATLVAALACTLCGPLAAQVESRGGEPRVERTVVEDDGVRIEELRVRGHTQRIVVQSKVGGVRPYEILVAPPGRDPSKDKGGASGQRVWHILSF